MPTLELDKPKERICPTIDEIGFGLESLVAEEILESPSEEELAKEPAEVELQINEDDPNQIRGEAIADVLCPLTETVYMRQGDYGIPHTTTSETGDTFTTIVEDARPELCGDGAVRARLRIKGWSKQYIQTNFTTSKALITDSNERTLDNKIKKIFPYQDYLRNIKYRTPISYDNEFTNAITVSQNQWYSLYEDNQANTSCTDTTYSTYRKGLGQWTENWGTHVNYWAGRSKPIPVDPRFRLREIIRSRMAPAIHVHRKGLGPPQSEAEMRARQTLRRIVGNKAFRKYLTKGFLTIYGESNRVYQVFPGHKTTKVWEQGKLIEELCIVLTGGFPPTDYVIMRICLIEQSEDDFRNRSNVSNRLGVSYAPANQRRIVVHGVDDVNEAPLTEVFSALKDKVLAA